MPDINLLEDTKEGGLSKKKAKHIPPAPVEYSSPESVASGPRPLKKPSAFGLWIQSFFNRPLGGQRQKPGASVPSTPSPRTARPKSQPSIPEPPDIFADLPTVSGGPEALTKPQPQEFIPTHKQKEFPPLPTIPSPPTPPTPPPPPATLPPLPKLGHATSISPPPPPIPDRHKKKPGKHKEETTEAEFSGVNLLPEELVTSFDAKKKLTTLGLVVTASILFVGIIAFGLVLWRDTQVRKTNETRGLVAQTSQAIAGLRDEQLLAIDYQVKNGLIRQLLNRHVYWTRFLEAFEEVTLSDVFYPGGISATLNGQMTMTGKAPTIDRIVQQIEVYSRATEFLNSVQVNTITRAQSDDGQRSDTDLYDFIVDFTVRPETYYDPIDDDQAESSQSAP